MADAGRLVGAGVLVCSAFAAQAATSTATVTAGQTFTVASSPLGGLGGCGISAGVHTYGTASPFTTAAAGSYRFKALSGTGSVSSDPFLAVYLGSFNPASPTTNLVGCNDDTNGRYPQFDATLDANTTYVAVAMAYAAGTGNVGTVDFSIGVLPTLTFSGASFDVGAASPSMTATSTSPAAITYTSSNPAVATINASTGALTLLSAGTSTITASQAEAASPSLYIAGSRTATLTVTAAAAEVAPASQTITATAGTAITATAALSATGFTGTASYAISPALPTGLVLDTSTGVISGTPAATQAATTYTITATGATSGSATASVSLVVAAQSQSALTVIASPSAIRAGKTSTLSTTGGSGTGAVSYAVSSGACTVSGNTLTAGSTMGTCGVTATKAADSAYAAATGTTTITVGASLAQAVDATVRGSIAAQASAAIRFADTQVGHVADHLQQLGSGRARDNRVRLGLVLANPNWQKFQQYGSMVLAAVGADPSVNAAGATADVAVKTPLEESLGALSVGKKNDALLAQAADADAAGGPDRGNAAVDAQSLGFWAAGNIDYGHLNTSGNTNKFSTDGLTFGYDHQVNAVTVAGLALGYGTDRTDVDAQGTRVRGDALSLIGYGLYQPQADVSVDGLIGANHLSFRNTRYSALSSTQLASHRKGNSLFVAVGVSRTVPVDTVLLKPYLRFSHLRSTLQAYDEGSDANALAFQRMRLNSTAIFGGVVATYDIPVADDAKWTLTGKAEARRNASGSYEQDVSFADDASDSLSITQRVVAREVYTAGVGARYTHKNGVHMGLMLQKSRGSAYRSGGLRAELGVPF